MRLTDLSAAGVGVLLEDEVCGRVLLDCGTGVLARAALEGVPLTGLNHVLVSTPDSTDPGSAYPHMAQPGTSDPGPARPPGPGVSGLDPALPVALPPGVRLHRPGPAPSWATYLSGVDPSGPGGWLLSTSAGPLLHLGADVSLAEASVAALPARVSLSRPPGPVATAQLARLQPRSPRTNRRILVTGGTRSGKSALAESLLADHEQVTYLATGMPADVGGQEWARRVQAHRARRPASWSTVEGLEVATALLHACHAVLWDSVGSWLTGTLDAAGAWESDDPTAELGEPVEALLRAWSGAEADVVAVTEEVGSGVVPATRSGRVFADELGRLNAALAGQADQVWLVTAGVGQRLR